MRYVYSMLVISILLILIVAGFAIKDSRPVAEPVIQVNDRAISAVEFRQIYADRPYRIDDSEDFLDSIITREILIQEAHRLKIDHEESFRNSIKKYYEQTLTRILLDRKAASLSIEPTPEQVSRYIRRLNMQVEFNLCQVGDDGEIVEEGQEEESYIKPYRDLATPYQLCLLSLKDGENSEPFILDGERRIVRLERSTPALPQVGENLNEEQARLILAQAMQRQALEEWLIGLRDKAKINVDDSFVRETLEGKGGGDLPREKLP
ncbi:MAG: SurA N-terminal domain-containing protein [Proteobacteria bacterium]|nr:SurA N-terminal domain-containing protein [Pseudomonadota bacterium]MBU1688215.1 SurA N-terminal domain-containing protein [Pseudomonadota bacterium]